MHRPLLLACVAVALVATQAAAQNYVCCGCITSPAKPAAVRDLSPGINLSFDDCGLYGTAETIANCTTNSGVAMTLIGSAVPPAGTDRVLGIDAAVEVMTDEPALSPWWTLDGCRSSGLAFSFDFTDRATPHCHDFFAGQGLGLGAVSATHVAPNRFQIRVACATPTEQAMDPNAEHYLFSVKILRAKSTGGDACAGCNDAACLYLSRIVLVQPQGVGDVYLWTPLDRGYVSYVSTPVAARNRTWGQIKSLYR